MPIFVKDFIWKQSNQKIFIQVPLKGIHHSKVDIFVSNLFLKLSYPPFIFETYLLHEIDDTDVQYVFTDTEALIELTKNVEMHWESLEGHYKKEDKMKLKEAAIEDVHNKTTIRLDERRKRENDLRQFAIKQAIENDSKEVQRYKNIRDAECKQAMDDLERWRGQVKYLNEPTMKPSTKVLETKCSNSVNIMKNMLNKPKSNLCDKVNKTENRVVPAIRQGGTLVISFTERAFPTPSRESSSKDEAIWLKKLNNARRATGFISEDLRPEEHNPQWCKNKGDELFKHGNYLGAINAYTHGIKLSDKLPSLYSNRAATHYALGNFLKCVEDCSTALELLVPHCDRNLDSRVKCIVRRAVALTRIGMLHKAINEMKFAIKLRPGDDKLRTDLYNMERAWEQDPDSD